MKPYQRPRTHPGAILKRQYLDPLKISVTYLARSLSVSRKTISKIVNERGPVTADMALRLSQAFDTTPELWLNLQLHYDLWQAAKLSHKWKQISSLSAFG